MSTLIERYSLSISRNPQTLKLPKGSQVVGAYFQLGQLSLDVMMQVNNIAVTYERRFIVVPTGFQVDEPVKEFVCMIQDREDRPARPYSHYLLELETLNG